MNRRLLEYSPVFDSFGPPPALPGKAEAEEAPVHEETEEMSLAAELLDPAAQANLPALLRRIVGRAGVLGARVVRSPMGPVLIGELVHALRPLLARPRPHARIGFSARVLGLELEGLSPEDKEFALARQLVRLTGEAARQAGHAGGASPAAARGALREAARRYAPGLLPALPPARGSGGCWTRQGRQLILHDC